MEIIVTIGGLFMGMILGGFVLLIIIKSAKKKCDVSFLEDEKAWDEELDKSELSEEELSEK